jgi:hypothetical protein
VTNFNIQNSKIEQLNDKGDNIKLVSESGNNAVSQAGNVTQTSASASGGSARIESPKEEGHLAWLWGKVKAGFWWLLGLVGLG